MQSHVLAMKFLPLVLFLFLNVDQVTSVPRG